MFLFRDGFGKPSPTVFHFHLPGFEALPKGAIGDGVFDVHSVPRRMSNEFFNNAFVFDVNIVFEQPDNLDQSLNVFDQQVIA